jgi:hypothetical protein
VELALVLPLVCGLFLLLVQVALVARSQILLTHATREAARAVALEPATATATAVDAGRRTAGLDPDRLQLTVEPGGEPALWTVRGRYRLPLVVPLLNLARGGVTLSSLLVVRAEPG